MKKWLLITVLILGLLTSCGKPNPSGEPEVIKVAALTGATTIGMAKLINDAEGKTAKYNYDFKMTTTDEIVPMIVKGEVDFAAVPANLAAVLYNNTKGQIQVIGINTLGVLYVMEKGDEINSVADLKGKTIYTMGKGTTPEYILNHILESNGLVPGSDVKIEFKSEPSEIITLLLQDKGSIALLPQPFAITAMTKVEGLREALDMNQEWDKITSDSSTITTGVIVGRKEFMDNYPLLTSAFLDEYAESTEYTKTNLKEAAELTGKYGIVPAGIAEQAIPKCNITLITGEEMKSILSEYLAVLNNQNPQSVGGTLPDDGFYKTDISETEK